MGVHGTATKPAISTKGRGDGSLAILFAARAVLAAATHAAAARAPWATAALVATCDASSGTAASIGSTTRVATYCASVGAHAAPASHTHWWLLATAARAATLAASACNTPTASAAARLVEL